MERTLQDLPYCSDGRQGHELPPPWDTELTTAVVEQMFAIRIASQIKHREKEEKGEGGRENASIPCSLSLSAHFRLDSYCGTQYLRSILKALAFIFKGLDSYLCPMKISLSPFE